MIPKATFAKNCIVIFSGEKGALNGTYNLYTGKRTLRAIKMKLTREQCNGDRWANAYIHVHNSAVGKVFVNIFSPDDFRTDCDSALRA